MISRETSDLAALSRYIDSIATVSIADTLIWPDAVVGGPAGNVWLTYDHVTGDYYLGNYDGSAWTPLSTGLPSGIMMSTMLVRVADKVYFKELGNNGIYYADYSALTSWTNSTSGVATSGARIRNINGYLYQPYHTQPINRFLLPTGGWDAPMVSGASAGEDIVEKDGVLYMISSNSNNLLTSSDYGLNWTTTSGNHGSNIGGASGRIDTDGTLIVFAYKAGDGYVYSKSTNDDGATFSGTQLTLGTGAGVGLMTNGFKFHDGKWFAILVDGRCAYSTNGTSWTAGATLPNVVDNVSFGIGCIVVGCGYREHYITTDHGASWSLFSSPVGSGTAEERLYTFWIGETTAG